MTEEKDIANSFCKKPDRDIPGIICGYPIPCPYHNVTIENGKVTGPDSGDERFQDIAKAVRPKRVIKAKIVCLGRGAKQDLLDHLSRLRQHLRKKLDDDDLLYEALTYLRDQIDVDIVNRPVHDEQKRLDKRREGMLLHAPECTFVAGNPGCSCGARSKT